MKEPRELMREPLREATELAPAPAVGVNKYPSYGSGQAVGGSQFLDYWRAIRKRLWLVAGIIILITTLTAIYMVRKPNIYAANAIVQVDLEQVNPDLITTDRQRPISNPDPAYFNTQLQLLWSDSLLRRVIKEKNLDTTKEFQHTKSEASNSTWLSVLKAVGLASADRDTSAQHGAIAGDNSIASSEDVNEAIRLAPYVDAIHKNLDIEPVRESRATVKDTRLINISFKSTNPDLAAYV